MVMENLHIETAIFTSDNGRKDSSMAMEFGIRIMGIIIKVNGKMMKYQAMVYIFNK